MTDLFDTLPNLAVVDETKDHFTELVGDGKKFKTPQELAKAKAFADAHITNLETSLTAMREELQKRKTAEDLINQMNLINQRREAPPSNLDDTRRVEPTDGNDAQSLKSGLTPEDVERMFAERDSKRQQESNLNLTTQKLREAYGDDASKVLQAKATELGVDADYLRNLAKSTPSVFLSLFPAKANVTKDVFNAPPSSTFRTSPSSYTGPKYSDFKNRADKQTPKWHRELMAAAERATDDGTYELFKNS